MSRLKKYTLSKSEDSWKLKSSATGAALKFFDKKQEATAGGVLKKLVSSEGSSVSIRKANGKIQEERTYTRSKDPRRSLG